MHIVSIGYYFAAEYCRNKLENYYERMARIESVLSCDLFLVPKCIEKKYFLVRACHAIIFHQRSALFSCLLFILLFLLV